MTSGARRERQRRIVLSTIRAGFQTARRITSPRADQSAVYRAPAPAQRHVWPPVPRPCRR